MITITAELKGFLAQGRTGDALSHLLKMSEPNKQIHDSILMVLAEFNELNSARLRGTVTNEEATLRQNKINEKVLWALDSFDNEGKVLPGSMVKKGSASEILGKITLFLSGIGLLFLAIAKGVSKEDNVTNGLITAGKRWTETFYFKAGTGVLFLAFWAFCAYLLSLVISALKK